MESLNDYLDCLPQKPPFLFVSELESVEHLKNAVGTQTFPTGHPIFENHLPGEPLVPGVILIEALAQLSGVILMPPEGPPAWGYLAEVSHVRFRRLVRPDDTILLRSTLQRQFASAARFEVSAEVEGEVAVAGSLTLGGMTAK